MTSAPINVDPIDTWDRSNGRIYKVETKGAKPTAPIDSPLGKTSSKELVALLDNPNSWWSGEARRVLGERRDATVVPLLRKMVLEDKGKLALESLWALYVSGGFDEDFAAKLLDHPNPDVRTWAIRLVGDSKKVSSGFRDQLVSLARTETSATVRSQLCLFVQAPARAGLSADCPAIADARRGTLPTCIFPCCYGGRLKIKPFRIGIGSLVYSIRRPSGARQS